jgi:hypothetical protein
MAAVSDPKDQIALSALNLSHTRSESAQSFISHPSTCSLFSEVTFFVRQRVSGQETIDRAPITLGCVQYTHNEKVICSVVISDQYIAHTLFICLSSYP